MEFLSVLSSFSLSPRLHLAAAVFRDTVPPGVFPFLVTMGYRFFAQVHYSVSQRVEFVLLLMNIQHTRTNSPSNAGAGAAAWQTDSCSCQAAVLHVQVVCVISSRAGEMTRAQRYNPAH